MIKNINTIKNFAPVLVLSVVIILLTPMALRANSNEKAKKARYRMDLSYTKFTDGDKNITARLYYKKGTAFFNVSDAVVQIYAVSMEEERLLAKVETNEKGKAVLQIAAGYKLPWDDKNNCTFIARFDGDETGKAADEEIAIKNINIDFDFFEEDEKKFVNVSITEPSDTGAAKPIYDAEVYGYITRLYSMLPFGEDYSDEEGKITYEFPARLPGDSLGNLTVIVKIDESDEYGTVETSKTINWGIAVDFSESTSPRSLWTDDAPIWMSFAVMIILAGVWLNFAFAIYKIIKVKKLGNN